MADHKATGILAYLRHQRQAMVDLLCRLALLESPSGDRAALDRVLRLLAAELNAVGMKVRQVRGRQQGDCLWARPVHREDRSVCMRDQRTQLLVGHCDTVWSVGTLKQMPVRQDGNLLTGPGVLDMKGGLVQMLFALRAVRELNLTLPATPMVVINSDEEIGSQDSTPVIRRLASRSDRAFILEPAFGRSGKLKTARKAVGTWEVVIKGKAAHAGVNPEEGASAVLEMAHQVQRLFALNDPSRGVTVNVGTVDGGLRPNVVAPEVRATVDVRVPTLADAERIESSLSSLRPVNPQTTIEVRGAFEHAPMEQTPRNQALWLLAHDLGKHLGLELEQASVGGASDGNTTSLYTATLDGLGAVGDGAHAPHEQIQIDQMAERSALLVLLLLAPLNATEHSHDPRP